MQTDDYFTGDIPEAPPEPPIEFVLSGHGAKPDGLVRVPTGIELNFWSSANTALDDEIAGWIETDPRAMQKYITPEKHGRGDFVPNYALKYPDDLDIQKPKHPTSVQIVPSEGNPLRLGTILDTVKSGEFGTASKPTEVHWVACRGPIQGVTSEDLGITAEKVFGPKPVSTPASPDADPDNPVTKKAKLSPSDGPAHVTGSPDAPNISLDNSTVMRGGTSDFAATSPRAHGVEATTKWQLQNEGPTLSTSTPDVQIIRPDFSAVLKQSDSTHDAAIKPQTESAASIKEIKPRAMTESSAYSTKAAGVFDNLFNKHNVNCDIVPTAADSRSYRDPNHIGAGEAIAHGYGSASVDGTHVQAKGHFDVEANAYDARGTFSDGALQGAGEFQLGTSAQGDGVFEVDPNNGTLVTSASGSAFVGQKANLMLSQDVDGCKFGQSIDQSAGALASGNATVNFDPTHGSIGAGGYGSYLAGVSVHTGASIEGGGVAAGAGVGYMAGVGAMAGGNLGIKKGKLDVSLTFGAALGIGLNVDFRFAIDFNRVADEIHADEIAHAFKDFGEITEDAFDQFGTDLQYCSAVIEDWADESGDALKDFGNDVKDGLEDFGHDIEKGFNDFGSAFKHAFRF